MSRSPVRDAVGTLAAAVAAAVDGAGDGAAGATHATTMTMAAAVTTSDAVFMTI
jgi:hypothetical protein